MAGQLTVVYTAAGQAEANLIKSMFEAANIPVMVSQEGAGSAFGFTLGLMGAAEILVPEQYADQARGLIEAWQNGDLEKDGDRPAE